MTKFHETKTINDPKYGKMFCISENELQMMNIHYPSSSVSNFVQNMYNQCKETPIEEMSTPQFKFKENDELQLIGIDKSITIKGTCIIKNKPYYIVKSDYVQNDQLWSQTFVEKYYKLKKNDSKTPKFKHDDEIICSYNPNFRYKVLDVQYDEINGHYIYKLLNDGTNFEHIGKIEFFDFEFIDKNFIYKKDYKNLPFLFRVGDLLINKINQNQRLKVLTTFFDAKTNVPMYCVKIIGTGNIYPKGTDLDLSKETVETFYEIFYRE